MRGYLPESQYDTKTREVIDDFYPRALQWCSNDPAPDNLTSVLIDNKVPIPIYTIHDVIQLIDWNRDVKTTGEYYIDEYGFEWVKVLRLNQDFTAEPR